jgi:putative acetyltransferase
MPVRIRSEETGDARHIRAINVAAFQGDSEANLVDLLRQRADPLISLVAHDGEHIVGHIMFSPVTLSSGDEFFGMGLAPMAVAPVKQRQGIGSALVERGLEECRLIGMEAVVVLGHPQFYPRFGFAPASRFGLRCEYDAPDEAFMALELRGSALKGKTGTIRYHPAFALL